MLLSLPSQPVNLRVGSDEWQSQSHQTKLWASNDTHPKWENVQIDFSRAQAIRGLENALKTEGLNVENVEIVDLAIGAGHSDESAQRVAGTQLFGGRRSGGHNTELVALIRGEVDAIFLKDAHAAIWSNTTSRKKTGQD